MIPSPLESATLFLWALLYCMATLMLCSAALLWLADVLERHYRP